MAKQDGVVGVYVAHGRLTLATMKGKNVQTAWIDIPENVAKSSEILSKNLFSQFIKNTMKENGMKAKKAAFVIGSEKVLVREINMPKMSDQQLKVNLPYEFRDYIRGELKDYLYDYAVRSINTTEDGKEIMDLLAVAIPTEYYNTILEILSLAGLKLVRTIPELYVIEKIIELYDEEERVKERCFLDIGNNTIRMQIYKNGKYKLTNVIDVGETYIIRAIADAMNVDMELARTYLRTKYQECDHNETVINAYKDVSLEVMKGFNFYEMSDMSSRLNDVVVYGSGAMIDPLVELLKERLGKNVTTIAKTFPQYNENGDLNITAASVGALLSLETTKDSKDGSISYDINFAKEKENKKGSIIFGIVGTVVALIAIALFTKFLILDRYSALAEARQYADDLQMQLDTQTAYLNKGDELADEFYHFTWTDMTVEEKERVSRKEVTEIVKLINSNKVKVDRFSLSENLLTVDIITDTLQSVSILSESLNDQEIVESVIVENAQKLEDGGYEKVDYTLDGDVVTTTVEGEIVVVAKLKIYLKSNSAMYEDTETEVSDSSDNG